MGLNLLFIIYCFEAGFFFLLAPWTRFWSMNPLLHYSPVVAAIAENLYLRGFISGFGVVHLLVGGREIFEYYRRRGHTSAG